MANFSLKDTEGTPVTLYGFRGKRAVVLAFTGTDCPIGNLYAPRLVELNKAYADRGVVFLAINSNAHETVEQVAAHAREHGIDFPVLKDSGHLVADLALVERTCEVVVLDGRAQIRYRGAIDDQYTRGARKASPAHPYLREALDAVLAGEEVKTPATAVAGCLLDRAEPKPASGRAEQKVGPRVRPAAPEIVAALKEKEAKDAVEVGPVTFAADVARIVQEKCQSCHRPGQVGPFSLRTYDDARRHSAT
ncbi:MAG: redoxin domain-containing protein, partial [Singulisphaera sp.]